MRIRAILLVVLPLLAAATPAAAQDAASPPRFPGVPWGIRADSVIRLQGPPVERRDIDRGLEELDYTDRSGGDAVARYVIVHPSLGTMIAGYSVGFGAEDECRGRAQAALDEIGRGYPRLRWDGGGAPDAAAVCDGTPGNGGAAGRDPESGTRIGIRVNRAGTRLVADAISPEGFRWIGTAQ